MNFSRCFEIKIVTSNQNRDLVDFEVGVCFVFQVFMLFADFSYPR